MGYRTGLLYATLNLSNDYFTATVDAEFEYEYYDVGGWILEDTDLRVQQVIPTRAPEVDLVLGDLLTGDNIYRYYYHLELEEEQFLIKKDSDSSIGFMSPEFDSVRNVSGRYECYLWLQYRTAYVEGTAKVYMAFEKDNNWYFDPYDNYGFRNICDIIILDCHEINDGFFDSLCGEYYCERGYSEYTLYVDINDEMSFPICTSNERYNGYSVTKENSYTLVIDPLNLETLEAICALGEEKFDVERNKFGCFDKVN